MLISRRQALTSLSLGVCSGIAWSLPRPLRTALGDDAPFRSDGPQASADKAFDDHLRAELARLEMRENSEAGIPVFLACVNLVPHTPSQPAEVTLAPFSAALASSFHRNAEAFQRLRRDAKSGDVASVIGVLADRDFSTGSIKEAM